MQGNIKHAGVAWGRGRDRLQSQEEMYSDNCEGVTGVYTCPTVHFKWKQFTVHSKMIPLGIRFTHSYSYEFTFTSV